jgi:hypothetical protein
MIARRALLAAPLALAAARARAGTGEPVSGRLGFSVVRKGSEIGTHALTFRRAGAVLEVQIDVRMAIGIGPITLFRYRHTGVETYREDRFAELATTTDNDGEALHVTARREAAGVVVDSSKLGRQTLPAAALPLTHWNIANMAAPLFNPQDGKPMDLTVAPRGTTRVALASGAEVSASEFALTGEATLEDWYDTSDVWTALRATLKDGSVLEYRRIA